MLFFNNRQLLDSLLLIHRHQCSQEINICTVGYPSDSLASCYKSHPAWSGAEPRQKTNLVWSKAVIKPLVAIILSTVFSSAYSQSVHLVHSAGKKLGGSAPDVRPDPHWLWPCEPFVMTGVHILYFGHVPLFQPWWPSHHHLAVSTQHLTDRQNYIAEKNHFLLVRVEAVSTRSST